jgi:beta-lactamase class A
MTHDELEKRNKILERRWKIAIVVAVLFVVTRPVALYLINRVIHKAVFDANQNEYKFIDPARKFIPQEDYIVNIQPLRDYLSGLGRQYPDRISIYYEQLNSGANIAVNRDLRLFPASLTKLPIAIIVVKRVEDNMWQWDSKFTINAVDISSDSGDLYKTVKPGDQMTADQLLTKLIVDSDNTAQNVFLHNIGQPDLDRLQQEVGLDNLFDEQGNLSAKEYSRLLRVLYTSSYLERNNSEKILDLMAEDTFHDYLSQGIPDGVVFAHKYGENRNVGAFADSGIVYIPGKPYMLTVMLKGADNSEASRAWAVNLMKEISQKAYDFGKEKIGYIETLE